MTQGASVQSMEENRESPGLRLCQQVADFMRMIVRFKIDGTDPALVPIPSGFSSDMMEDSYLCVDILLKACLTINTCTSRFSYMAVDRL